MGGRRDRGEKDAWHAEQSSAGRHAGGAGRLIGTLSAMQGGELCDERGGGGGRWLSEEVRQLPLWALITETAEVPSEI